MKNIFLAIVSIVLVCSVIIMWFNIKLLNHSMKLLENNVKL